MSLDLHIYNTLSRQKEVFVPLIPSHVGMYVCGPTVYGEPHLGHARPSITFDIVFRYLQHLGLKVRYVRNITDAGHLALLKFKSIPTSPEISPLLFKDNPVKDGATAKSA